MESVKSRKTESFPPETGRKERERGRQRERGKRKREEEREE